MLAVDKYLQQLNNAIKHVLITAKNLQVKCEVSANINWGTSVNIRLQNIESVEFNHNTRVSITVYKDQHQGTVSITSLDNTSLEKALAKAITIAKFTEADPFSGLADPQLITNKFIDNLDLYHPYNINPDLAIIIAKKCELAALNYHKQINNSDGAIFNYTNNIVALGNSHDFIAAYPETSYSLSCTVIAEHNNNMQRDGDFTIARNFEDLILPEIIGNNAGAYAHQRLGAIKSNTCKTKALFIPAVAVRLFRYFIAAISGDNIVNQSSFLLNCINKQIFPDFVEIIDHPFIKRGLKSCFFDSDGIATKKQSIVSQGKLNTYLLNNYFAKKLKLNPTGHANGIHNLFINNKDVICDKLIQNLPLTKFITYQEIWNERESIIKEMGTGLIVTETIGQGVNLVTGDYSTGVFGFWVENGKIAYPVHEVTIAGNLLEMFFNIKHIGTDYDYKNNIITGSVLIDNITVAGK